MSIKKLARDFLLKKNVRISRTKPLHEIKNLILKLRPLSTEHPLIRLGGYADGGYLVPDDLQDIKYCFSPGVSTISNFEDDLTKRGIKCFLADFSVDQPPNQNDLFDFEKKFLGTFNSDIYFTLSSWIKSKVNNNKELILQMDIEGDEYNVLCDTDHELLKRFRIIIVEFHYLDSMLDSLGYELINLTFSKLLKDFEIVHIHPNNCSYPVVYKDIQIPPVLEISFLRKDRIQKKEYTKSFPHFLDQKNIPQNLDFTLPKCFYKN